MPKFFFKNHSTLIYIYPPLEVISYYLLDRKLVTLTNIQQVQNHLLLSQIVLEGNWNNSDGGNSDDNGGDMGEDNVKGGGDDNGEENSVEGDASKDDICEDSKVETDVIEDDNGEENSIGDDVSEDNNNDNNKIGDAVSEDDSNIGSDVSGDDNVEDNNIGGKVSKDDNGEVNSSFGGDVSEDDNNIGSDVSGDDNVEDNNIRGDVSKDEDNNFEEGRHTHDIDENYNSEDGDNWDCTDTSDDYAFEHNDPMMARRTESACRFFCRYPQLTELKLFNWKDASHLLMAVGQHCPQLQHLTVRYSRIRFVKDLLAVAQGCPCLRTLDLEAQQHLLDLFFYSVTRKVVNL